MAPRRAAPGLTVADAMVTRPRLHPVTATAGEVRAALADPHVHQVLLVDGDRLDGTVERDDVAGLADDVPVREVGRLEGRTVDPGEDLARTHADMLALGRRRLAVVDPDGTLLGLLCLKASGTGFCTDTGISARHA